jgi:hypothetical protein
MTKCGPEALIGVIVIDDCHTDGFPVAYVAVSNKGYVKSDFETYSYAVMETLFNTHPLFNGTKCSWRDATKEDHKKWVDSHDPTIYVW